MREAPTDYERREVARRLRELDYADLQESLICAYLDALGIEGYADWVGIAHRLADLIEPQSITRDTERTCQIVVSIDRSPASYGGRVHRCSSCGKALPGALFRNGWTQLDYCPRCGARVTEVVRDVD